MKTTHSCQRLSLLIFLFTAVTFTSHAQEINPKGLSILKLNPVSAVDPFSFPTVSLSYERRLSKIISLSTEFGYQFYQLREGRVDTVGRVTKSAFTTNSDTSFVSPKGFKINIEGRYYFLRPRFKRRLAVSGYTGINLFYRQNTTDIAIFYLKETVTRAIDCYWMKRTNYGALNVSGMQFVSKKIAVDVYAGIGFMHRTVLNYNREYDKDRDKLYINRHGFGWEHKFLSEYNNESIIGFSAGIRIGYMLR